MKGHIDNAGSHRLTSWRQRRKKSCQACKFPTLEEITLVKTDHRVVKWNGVKRKTFSCTMKSCSWSHTGKKKKTVGRAQAWEKIANNLNKRAEFKVNKRSVRDHYMVLVEKFKKMSQELKASGISPEPTKLDRLLEEIIERAEVCEQSRDEVDDNAREKIWKKQEQAKDIRLKAMESLSETKKQSLSDGDGENQPKAKKRRSNGNEMVAYLREQATEENRLKERDIVIRSVQLQKEAERQQLLDKQQSSLMELLLQQQQQQQRQQQQQFQQQQQQQFLQMQTYMAQQQQQQHKMLMAILEKKFKIF